MCTKRRTQSIIEAPALAHPCIPAFARLIDSSHLMGGIAPVTTEPLVQALGMQTRPSPAQNLCVLTAPTGLTGSGALGALAWGRGRTAFRTHAHARRAGPCPARTRGGDFGVPAIKAGTGTPGGHVSGTQSCRKGDPRLQGRCPSAQDRGRAWGAAQR